VRNAPVPHAAPVLRVVGGALLIAVALTGCGRSAEEQAHADVQDRLDGMHAGYLAERARDPASTGAAALEELDPYGYALSAAAEGDTITLVHAVGSVVETGGGLSYEQVSVGACIQVSIRAGDGGDDHGSVTTEAVACPEGTRFRTEKGDTGVDVVSTDLDGRSDDVGEPPPRRSVCLSGELCTVGGG
jgi:hypothetical protein